ncbi:YkgB family protein [Acetobacter orientalis]|uniref:DUF417 family protein n=1 Tax=Acetobacter orientalis TaxID=146474 RepID=UPI00209E74D1|nr:DUF417 family protein [Acetobacter orientalis]MCP1216486.1 YkgB family protein [Acetobacter orientalis]MCP1219256.1 YkgB family protein [Acetobacter orientalis]
MGLLYSHFGVQDATYTRAIIENITLITLILGYVNVQIGIIGDILVLLTDLVTISLLPQLGRLDSFIIKDVLLLGSGLVLLKSDLRHHKAATLSCFASTS